MSGIARIAPTVTKSVALRGVETPDNCQNFQFLELSTFVETPDEPNQEHEELTKVRPIPDTSSMLSQEN
jgi:hypothetical protein